jgi:hypothetical protein
MESFFSYEHKRETKFHRAESAWEANSRSADQEIPRLLRNSEVYYRVHKSLILS